MLAAVAEVAVVGTPDPLRVEAVTRTSCSPRRRRTELRKDWSARSAPT
jgi:acyl-coenzyme A synthetase/AMP-(fatty) acid ligase